MPRKHTKPKYGGRGRNWHPDFETYMGAIAHHPAYRGMPDAFPEPDRIQWEAPSNRLSGRFKDTHHKRRRWWEAKATEIGIEPGSHNWISRTAKAIHPFQRKPCKICGRILELRYVYPRQLLLSRIRRAPFYEANFEFPPLERISDLVRRLFEAYGKSALTALPAILRTSAIRPPNFTSIDHAIKWIEQDYVPREPALLSPGAMSNAPDRFDGFHSDNLCCRSTADKGRHRSNLVGYVTDRRVFEYWTSGDWIAADRMMGLLRSPAFESQQCRNGHPGPCSADHIGPISLGFVHRPCFQALCRACNSGKNNRMTYSDVELLRKHEKLEPVISWHSKSLWDGRKASVTNGETALRLSKLLRDNRHILMAALQRIAEAGHYRFLATLLELHYADYDVDFVNVRVVDHVVTYDKIKRTPRRTLYAAEQKARRCRVAFRALLTYFEKDNRSTFDFKSEVAEQHLQECLLHLRTLGRSILDEEIRNAAECEDPKEADTLFLPLVPQLEPDRAHLFAKAMAALQAYMDETGRGMSELWESDRYVRA